MIGYAEVKLQVSNLRHRPKIFWVFLAIKWVFATQNGKIWSNNIHILNQLVERVRISQKDLAPECWPFWPHVTYIRVNTLESDTAWYDNLTSVWMTFQIIIGMCCFFLDRLMGFRPVSVNPTRESTTQKAFWSSQEREILITHVFFGILSRRNHKIENEYDQNYTR